MEAANRVIFVGAGPGDPELITVKGLKALQTADLVVHAGSLVNPLLLQDMKPGARACDSSPLTLEQIVSLMAGGVRTGGKVVRLHTGDPSIYGAIQEQMEALEDLGISSEVIPGVTAASAAAAGLRQELTLPGVSQTVIITRMEGRTPVPEKERLSRIAALGATTCLYLSASMVERVVSELLAGKAFSRDTPAAVVARVGWEDETIVEGNLGNIASRTVAAGITRQAVILVGEVLSARTTGVPQKSKLYDRNFSHGYRREE